MCLSLNSIGHMRKLDFLRLFRRFSQVDTPPHMSGPRMGARGPRGHEGTQSQTLKHLKMDHFEKMLTFLLFALISLSLS
jgi:hypothetical protein